MDDQTGTRGSRGVVMVDVARLAGVSQKTVSRVVNDAPYVRPDVRERVNRAIEELGYRPNVAAQALARERTHTIGVLSMGTRLVGPSRRIFTLEHEARRLGYTMALVSVPDLSARSVADGVAALLKRGVEGVVVEVPTHLVEFDPGQLAGVPVVTSAGWIDGIAQQAVIDFDQEHACRELTDVPAGAEPRDGVAHRRSSGLGCGAEAADGLAVGPASSGPTGSARSLRRLVSRVGLPARTQAGRAI